MTQQLTLSTLNVVSNNASDKVMQSAASSKDNEVFASELDRRVNESGRQEKNNVNKADSKGESRQAERTENKDGKKLPEESKSSEKTSKDTAKPVEEGSETADEKAVEVVDEPVPAVAVAVVADDKKATETIQVTSKSVAIPQETEAVKTLLKENKSGKSTETAANTIRADILQAIQKPVGESESVATENFKSMMKNVRSMAQQANSATSEAVASLRQMEPKIDSGSSSKIAAPLVFSTMTTPAAVSAAPAPMASPTLSLDIQPQLNNAAWSKVMSSRVVWMAREGVQQAELRLNPAHLGPVEVRLSMQNDQTNVTFIASNAAARDALEQALPRLRDSFSENGLALNNAEVSHQGPSEQGTERDEQFAEGHNSSQVFIETDDMEDEAAPVSAESPDRNVGVSVFA